MYNELKYEIKSSKRALWLKDIVCIRNKITDSTHKLLIILNESINRNNFENYHIVTLSCLIDYAKKRKIIVYLKIKDRLLNSYIFNDIRIKKYWTSQIDKIYDSPEEKPFNVWRIEEQYFTNYAIALHQYFKGSFFKDKDLTNLNNCIIELFQNVVDHSKSNGTAFVAIKYIEQSEMIDIAICDFGLGIPKTLSGLYSSEEDAIVHCLDRGVTAKSNKHNFGYGLDNVLSAVGDNYIFRIVSNGVLLLKSQNKTKTFKLSFQFDGTLIYFNIPISIFENEEYVEELTF